MGKAARNGRSPAAGIHSAGLTSALEPGPGPLLNFRAFLAPDHGGTGPRASRRNRSTTGPTDAASRASSFGTLGSPPPQSSTVREAAAAIRHFIASSDQVAETAEAEGLDRRIARRHLPSSGTTTSLCFTNAATDDLLGKVGDAELPEKVQSALNRSKLREVVHNWRRGSPDRLMSPRGHDHDGSTCLAPSPPKCAPRCGGERAGRVTPGALTGNVLDMHEALASCASPEETIGKLVHICRTKDAQLHMLAQALRQSQSGSFLRKLLELIVQHPAVLQTAAAVGQVDLLQHFLPDHRSMAHELPQRDAPVSGAPRIIYRTAAGEALSPAEPHQVRGVADQVRHRADLLLPAETPGGSPNARSLIARSPAARSSPVVSSGRNSAVVPPEGLHDPLLRPCMRDIRSDAAHEERMRALARVRGRQPHAPPPQPPAPASAPPNAPPPPEPSTAAARAAAAILKEGRAVPPRPVGRLEAVDGAPTKAPPASRAPLSSDDSSDQSSVGAGARSGRDSDDESTTSTVSLGRHGARRLSPAGGGADPLRPADPYAAE